ncbi:Plasmodium vivax Vir protein, putative [Plasmodium vivax]|uniref:Vir protein, putative n=1 Tax=Plasmodium vivax TaxID=5855 RepID=A0A1G4EEV7_PLAVI|nr:Plasmodium vivax Vir protein, putative [Plasmodium vivax]
MTQCTSKSKEYVDYNCYHCLKDKFYGCYVVQDAKPYLNKALNSTFRNIPKFSDAEKLLIWILKHLSCTRVFYDGFINMPCKYINYWLNKKVQGVYPYDYNLKFDIFKKFVEDFYPVVEGYNNFKSCMNNIKFLDDDDDEYEKNDMLYTLYNMYDELKMIHEAVYIERNTCGIIHKITILANDIARRYENDDKFIKVLRDLRDEIKNGKGEYKRLCASKLEQLNKMVTQEAFPDKVPVTETPKETLQSSGSLDQSNLQPLAQLSEKGIGNQPGENVDLQASARTVQLSSGERLTQLPHERSPPEAQRPMGSSLGVSHHENSRHAGDSHEYISEPSLFPGEQYEQSRGAHSRSKYTGYNSVEKGITTGVTTPTDGTQSYLEGFKGTITGVLGSVDPGPVLVVSGGMGALFLLFKLDLSLEEEEDDSVKFLELLEDLHQEISQIFMNMKVGILDMVQ